MKIEVLGSTKVGYKLNKNEAINFSGKSAGICYLPDSIDLLFSEPEEKTLKRSTMTLSSGHHSVFDHPTYNLILIDIPKILAMILNNEKMYTTSEKSARYTKMQPSPEEKELYEKWIDLFKSEIENKYPNLSDKQALKLSQENARYLISIFTPATTMEYSVSFRQLNYILHWFEDFLVNEPDNSFTTLLKPYLKEFIDSLQDIFVPELNTNVKERKISLFDNRKIRQEEFGENYCTTYKGTFAQFAQAQRHRTLDYKISLLEKPEFYIPTIIKGTKLENEWLKDISSLSHLYPQGMLIQINERGTAENFILKCQERLCGCAQLEIMNQTLDTLNKYIEKTQNSNSEVYEYLNTYSSGVRCKFPNFKCTSPCIWGPYKAKERLI
ncbi:MAG: FAD-dependent thymidylate synthase [Clostridia bacterium]|nr:FAD-dependent thymidylate synthase [Clostridia bacterium]